MDLSIIIVNWKSSAFLSPCLASIYASGLRISFEIAVIDNASFDGCDNLLSQRFPEVRFLQSKENVGFAGANNRAFAGSTGSTVCFLNPDTILKGTALQTLYSALHGISHAGAVGALLFNGDGSLQTSCVLPFPTILNQALDIEWVRRRFPLAGLFGTSAIFPRTKAPRTVEAVSGACIMVRRTTFVEVGMFSSDYFMYAEDIDLCRKIRMAGHRIYLINAAEIVHFGGGSSKEQKSRLFSAILIRESNYRLLRKFRSSRYALMYRLSLGGMGLMRIAGVFLILVPATLAGRGRTVVEIAWRWWQVLLWAVGSKRMPQLIGTETPGV